MYHSLIHSHKQKKNVEKVIAKDGKVHERPTIERVRGRAHGHTTQLLLHFSRALGCFKIEENDVKRKVKGKKNEKGFAWDHKLKLKDGSRLWM